MSEEGRVPHLSDGIKQKSIDQRAPLPGEPKCVICGRYGEYICDQTDDDICSLQCKQTLVRRNTTTPARDECVYVRDSGGSSFATDAQLLRSKLEIHVQGAAAVPPPVLTFASCGLPPKLLLNLETAGYDFPTPIQMQAIPAALAGKSLLASADTGSGKTASFLVPIVSRCTRYRSEHPSSTPLAMVLAPTRELCIQVEDQAKMLGKGLPFKTALVVGGDPMPAQLYRIQQGVELIIGTPGRLVDLLAKHAIELDSVMMFVLDEVDCMLERGGFRDQVMQIFCALSQPQVLLFSATVSREVEKVGGSLAKEMISVSIGKPPPSSSRAVNQLAIWVDAKQKKQKLFEILKSQNHFKPPAVVYVSSRVGADLLANAITVVTGIKAVSIHGEKPMKERRDVMGSFLVGEVPVLVSTGVLGRGIDLLVVRQVIVFDMPGTIKEYIHVIGRASRMGNAIVFVNEENTSLFPDLVAALKTCGAAIPKELINCHTSTSRGVQQNKNKKRRVGY